jgi:hypothetical protein
MDCKAQSIKNRLSVPPAAQGRLIKMRLPAERANVQKTAANSHF